MTPSPASLILTVTPRGTKGALVGRIEGTDFRLVATRSPFIAAARSLLFLGVDPRTILILRNAGSAVDRVSGRLDTIVTKSGRKGPRAARREGFGDPDGPI